jgi:hypothetical protein
VCNEAENMKRNCPSVKNFFEILPDTLVKNCGTDLETKEGWHQRKLEKFSPVEEKRWTHDK